MSYVVLARKYRPTTFAELIGQDAIVRTLGNAIQMERVHHAFVFTGVRGTGKTTTARLVAKGLNCAQGPTISPCNDCTSCHDMASGVAQDVVEIDGASHTGVDNVRALRETVRYLPAQGRYKLYIIDEVHMLSMAAFNALLKTLEEPPPHVKFILATTEPHKIPATILSRCQRFDFRRVALSTLTKHLAQVVAQEGLSVPQTTLTTLARHSQGSVRDALSLLDQVLSYVGDDVGVDVVADALGTIDVQLVFGLVAAVVQSDADAALGLVAQAESRGYDLSELMCLVVEHLHDVALAKVLPDPKAHLPARTADEVTLLIEQAKLRSQPDWQRLFTLACDIAADVGRASMPRISLEMGLLRLMQVAPTVDLTAILSRLDSLITATPTRSLLQKTGVDESAAATTCDPALSAQPGSGRTSNVSQRTAQPDPLPTNADTKKSSAAPSQRAVSSAQVPVHVAQSSGGKPPLPESFVAHQAPGPHQPAQSDLPVHLAAAALPVLRDTPIDNDAAAGWRSFVDSIRQLRPAFASVLERGQLITFGATEVQVAFERKSFWWDSAVDSDNRALMLRVLTEQLGQEPTLQIVDVAHVRDKGETLADERERQNLGQWQAIEAQALAHDKVRAATAILGGEVQEVRPAADEEVL